MKIILFKKNTYSLNNFYLLHIKKKALNTGNRHYDNNKGANMFTLNHKNYPKVYDKS